MRRISLILAIMATAFCMATAQESKRVTVEATNDETAQNLDLEAVARAFGEAKDLEEFERVLNDPKNPLSNLDLNMDGYVDYLRVTEVTEKNDHLVVIQAVLGNDLYQDVATIEVTVSGSSNNNVSVVVVGDPYIYGVDYYIVPAYAYRPLIYDWWWGPVYHCCYASPWYWGYYPPYYYCYPPCPYHYYHTCITVRHWTYAAPVYGRHAYRTANAALDRRRAEVSRRDYAHSVATAAGPRNTTATRSAAAASTATRTATTVGARNNAVSTGGPRTSTYNATRSTTASTTNGSRSTTSSSTTSGSRRTSYNSSTSRSSISTSSSNATSGSRKTTSTSQPPSTSSTYYQPRSSSSSSSSTSTRSSSSSSSSTRSSSTSTRSTSSYQPRTSSSSSSSSSGSRSGGYSSGGSRGGGYSGGGTRSGGGGGGGGRRR